MKMRGQTSARARPSPQHTVRQVRQATEASGLVGAKLHRIVASASANLTITMAYQQVPSEDSHHADKDALNPSSTAFPPGYDDIHHSADIRITYT